MASVMRGLTLTLLALKYMEIHLNTLIEHTKDDCIPSDVAWKKCFKLQQY